jgi:hypothetical protein
MAAKSVLTNVEQEVTKVAKEVVAEVKKVETEVVGEVEVVLTEVEALFKKYSAELAGKTEAELRLLHDAAIQLDSDLKKELYVLRQRAANLATTAEADIEAEIVALKKKIVEAEAWLKAIEHQLAGKLKDVWGSTF